MKRRFKLHLKMFVLFTLLYFTVGIVSVALFYQLTPAKYFAAYPLLDIFFWLCGMTMTFFLNRSRLQNPDKMLNVFMLTRMAKFVGIIILLLVGIRILELDKMKFAISLMSNYLVYSILDMYVYYQFNKRLTEKKK